MKDIQYPEELKQSDILDRLRKLQTKANRRNIPIPPHSQDKNHTTSAILAPKISSDIPKEAA